MRDHEHIIASPGNGKVYCLICSKQITAQDFEPLDIVEDRTIEQRCLDGDFTQAAAIREGITLKTIRPNGGPLFLSPRNKRAHWTLTKGTENAVEVSYEAFKHAESLRCEQ